MKTILIQQTIRPEPAQPVVFRGTLEQYWTTHHGKPIRAHYCTVLERNNVVPSRGAIYQEPVVVRFNGDDAGTTEVTIIEVRNADTGEIVDVFLWVDNETDIEISGCFCSQDEQARAVAEVRDDVAVRPAPDYCAGNAQEEAACRRAGYCRRTPYACNH